MSMKTKVEKVVIGQIGNNDVYRYVIKIKPGLFRRWHTLTVGDLYNGTKTSGFLLFEKRYDAEQSLKTLESLGYTKLIRRFK